MKKYILAICLVGLLFAPVIALGQGRIIPDPEPNPGQDLPQNPVLDTMQKLFNWMWVILLVVAVLFIIIAAFMFLTASGNEESVKKAKDMILYAVIAIIVAAAAYGLVGIVRNIVE